MAPPNITQTAVDKINYGKSFNILKDSNADNYLHAYSHEDLLKNLLKNSKIFEIVQKSVKNESEEVKKQKIDRFYTMLSNVYQSITTKGMFSHEILTYIMYEILNIFNLKNLNQIDADNLPKEITDFIDRFVNDIAIFHIDYNSKNALDNANANFSNNTHINKLLTTLAPSFTYSSGGVLSAFYGSSTLGDRATGNKQDQYYNTAEFLNFAYLDPQYQPSIIKRINKNISSPAREEPSFSVILLNNRDLRAGTKNSLELSAFFNLLTTLELSKAYPYFNATFVLPSTSMQDKSRIFKTATINQFLFGSKPGTSNYTGFEGKVYKEAGGIGVKTNLSIFSMPQTAVNLNEKIGHDESAYKTNETQKALRLTTVHDSTRPFLTLKDFSLDVAPTKGLMSFKTGKISMILHDRTRMGDIAPFIKPDLFGAFGAEIAVEYGWSHTESQSPGSTNSIGKFLNSSICLEKYMITNSHFNIENNGQVNITLSIAMKGPIDIRQTEVFADSFKAITSTEMEAAIGRFEVSKSELTPELGGSSSPQRFEEKNAIADLNNKKVLTKKQTKAINKKKSEIKRVVAFLNNFNSGIVAHGTNPIRSRSDGPASYMCLLIFKSKNTDYMKQTARIVNRYLGRPARQFFQVLYSRAGDGRTGDVEGFAMYIGPITATSDNEQLQRQKRIVKRKFLSRLQGIINSLNEIDEQFKNIINYSNNFVNNKKSFIDSLIGGTKYHDMFFDKAMNSLIQTPNFGDKTTLQDVMKAIVYTTAEPKNKGEGSFGVKTFHFDDPIYTRSTGREYFEFIEDIKTQRSVTKNDFVTLGSVITTLVGTHMLSTKKYDEIQLIFHTVNEKAGLAGCYKKVLGLHEHLNNNPLNIASLLIKKSYLNDFLGKMFTERNTLTLESLINQIIMNFVATRDNPCYGLSNLYKRESFETNVKPLSDEELKNLSKKTKTVKDRLNNIYHGSKTEMYSIEPEFMPPDIHMSFDTLTAQDDLNRTICRITIYDKNDDPYKPLVDIYNDRFRTANSKFIELSNAMAEIEQKSSSSTKGLSKVESALKGLLAGDESIFDVEKIGENRFDIRHKPGLGFNTLKEKYRKLIPTATFSSSNTALINASVATVNEAKLNTVYITRSNRNKTEEVNSKILVDMPLRILPAQASVELFGCPWVNFGQYIFLDFETGTTIDNSYAVTGIKHHITPGGFKTSLSLSYGDVYGKYEGYADLFEKALTTLNDADSLLQGFAKEENLSTKKDVDKIKDKLQQQSVSKSNRTNSTNTLSTDFKLKGYTSNELEVLKKITDIPDKEIAKEEPSERDDYNFDLDNFDLDDNATDEQKTSLTASGKPQVTEESDEEIINLGEPQASQSNNSIQFKFPFTGPGSIKDIQANEHSDPFAIIVIIKDATINSTTYEKDYNEIQGYSFDSDIVQKIRTIAVESIADSTKNAHIIFEGDKQNFGFDVTETDSYLEIIIKTNTGEEITSTASQSVVAANIDDSSQIEQSIDERDENDKDKTDKIRERVTLKEEDKKEEETNIPVKDIDITINDIPYTHSLHMPGFFDVLHQNQAIINQKIFNFSAIAKIQSSTDLSLSVISQDQIAQTLVKVFYDTQITDVVKSMFERYNDIIDDSLIETLFQKQYALTQYNNILSYYAAIGLLDVNESFAGEEIYSYSVHEIEVKKSNRDKGTDLFRITESLNNNKKYSKKVLNIFKEMASADSILNVVNDKITIYRSGAEKDKINVLKKYPVIFHKKEQKNKFLDKATSGGVTISTAKVIYDTHLRNLYKTKTNEHVEYHEFSYNCLNLILEINGDNYYFIYKVDRPINKYDFNYVLDHTIDVRSNKIINTDSYLTSKNDNEGLKYNIFEDIKSDNIIFTDFTDIIIDDSIEEYFISIYICDFKFQKKSIISSFQSTVKNIDNDEVHNIFKTASSDENIKLANNLALRNMIKSNMPFMLSLGTKNLKKFGRYVNDKDIDFLNMKLYKKQGAALKNFFENVIDNPSYLENVFECDTSQKMINNYKVL